MSWILNKTHTNAYIHIWDTKVSLVTGSRAQLSGYTCECIKKGILGFSICCGMHKLNFFWLFFWIDRDKGLNQICLIFKYIGDFVNGNIGKFVPYHWYWNGSWNPFLWSYNFLYPRFRRVWSPDLYKLFPNISRTPSRYHKFNTILLCLLSLQWIYFCGLMVVPFLRKCRRHSVKHTNPLLWDNHVLKAITIINTTWPASYSKLMAGKQVVYPWLWFRIYGHTIAHSHTHTHILAHNFYCYEHCCTQRRHFRDNVSSCSRYPTTGIIESHSSSMLHMMMLQL